MVASELRTNSTGYTCCRGQCVRAAVAAVASSRAVTRSKAATKRAAELHHTSRSYVPLRGYPQPLLTVKIVGITVDSVAVLQLN